MAPGSTKASRIAPPKQDGNIAAHRRHASIHTAGLACACVLVLAACVWSAILRWRSGASRHQASASTTDSAFTDVTLETGIDFIHENGAAGDYVLCEIMGAGGAFVDYDGDGWLDIFLVQSGKYGRDEPGMTSRLYRNDGTGRFIDATVSSGAGIAGYGMGCAAADYDQDGFPDLFITRVGPDALLHNNGDGTFSDVTRQAGLENDGYSSSAAWLDYDRDGSLDLYVAQYTALTPESQVPCTNYLGHREYCDPSATPATRHLLYHNRGDGRFEDVSTVAGIALRKGYGLAVACSDFDADGWVDIYVANDQSPAFLWRNLGDGTFADVALQTGCAYNGQGVAIAGMGIVAEDFDRDGDLDIFVTNIRQFSSLFLRNDDGAFADMGFRWGNVSWMTPYTGFGAVAFDQDNDGKLELFVANGAVSRDRSAQQLEQAYAEPNQFLRRDSSDRFVSAADELAPDIAAPAVSRGLACGDYDNDGDVDLLVCRNDARPQLLRNNHDGGGNWLAVLPQDARGLGPVLNALITVEAGDQRWSRECRVHHSYLVSTDPRVHFGLGDAEEVDQISVRWPDGQLEWFPGTAVNRLLALRRGTGSGARRP